MSKHPEQFNVPGIMVVDERGRIGMIVSSTQKRCRIQYGADGPHATVYKKNLRIATDQEVEDAGFLGVGRADPKRKDLDKPIRR